MILDDPWRVALHQPGVHHPVREQGQTRLQRRVSAARPLGSSYHRERFPPFPLSHYHGKLRMASSFLSFPPSTTKTPVVQ